MGTPARYLDMLTITQLLQEQALVNGNTEGDYHSASVEIVRIGESWTHGAVFPEVN